MKHDEDYEVERIAVSCREALAGRQALLGMKKVEVLQEKRKGGLENGSSRPWHEGSPSFAARGNGGGLWVLLDRPRVAMGRGRARKHGEG